MRSIIYIVILALVFLAPVKRVDVANLLPIESVAVYMEDGLVVLETDTQNKGRGERIAEALANLKEMTPAVVYLDTAEYLMISQEATGQIGALREYFKPSVKVCVCDARNRVKAVAEYLQVHGKTVRLKQWENNEKK